MKRRRRCQVCKELFTADPRVGSRQQTCGRQECQRERHRGACKAWRDGERGAVQEDRFRRRLGAPEGELRLDVVRDECGPVIKVVLEESLRLALAAQRDESRVKVLEQRRDRFRLVDREPRDECPPEAMGP